MMYGGASTADPPEQQTYGYGMLPKALQAPFVRLEPVFVKVTDRVRLAHFAKALFWSPEQVRNGLTSS